MNQDNNQTLLFIHVPKTAGQTIDLVLHRQFPADAIYRVEKDIQGSYLAFQQMDPVQRAKYQAVKGHIPYGVHNYVDGPYAYFTFLRHPIERTISHYYFLKSKTGHPLASKLRDDGVSLDQLIELELDTMLFNAHTRLLSGVWYGPGPGQCTLEHLEMAKTNLRDKFKVVGLTERFDESLILLKWAFSWKDVRYHSENVSTSRPDRSELSEKTLSLVQDANVLDLELYKYGQALFEEQVKGHERQIGREVKKLRFANCVDRLTFPIRRHSVRTFIKNRHSEKT
ncbi:MAG TPA: sulfotransferase family 2 domain-containing protein [candidate division Zixibacteria bacterium]|nr:sulfotransferase family 2 domain-containing protein [candidate division Zixibacteria bacterium]